MTQQPRPSNLKVCTQPGRKVAVASACLGLQHHVLAPDTTVDDIQNSDDRAHASPAVHISATDRKEICRTLQDKGPCSIRWKAGVRPVHYLSLRDQVVKAKKIASFGKRRASTRKSSGYLLTVSSTIWPTSPGSGDT